MLSTWKTQKTHIVLVHYSSKDCCIKKLLSHKTTLGLLQPVLNLRQLCVLLIELGLHLRQLRVLLIELRLDLRQPHVMLVELVGQSGLVLAVLAVLFQEVNLDLDNQGSIRQKIANITSGMGDTTVGSHWVHIISSTSRMADHSKTFGGEQNFTL